MVKRALRRGSQLRVLFARVGWMLDYAGPVPGDERPVGGGRYNKSKTGHEVYNFQNVGGRLYGYFQPTMSSSRVALERIDAAAIDKEKLNDVLVVFVARRRTGGQVIVGWFKHATLFRQRIRRSPGKPRGYGHFCFAKLRDCTLLPAENRSHEIPSGKGGMGQSNVCYPLASDGSRKGHAWMQRALDFIFDYKASDILIEPQADAEVESAAATEKALARSKGQGFARNSEERKALEDHAMAKATRYFRKKRFKIEDVSARRPYDLHCKRGSIELHVEVKGTTTDGQTVVLTNNEVRHAQDRRNACVLFILHSISLTGRKASGGKQLVLEPWQLKRAKLTPVSFIYRL